MLFSDVLSCTDVLIHCSLCWMEYFCVTVWIENWFNVSISKLFHTFPLSYFIYICAFIESPPQFFSWALQFPSNALIVTCDENDNIMNAQFVISLAKSEGCIINPPLPLPGENRDCHWDSWCQYFWWDTVTQPSIKKLVKWGVLFLWRHLVRRQNPSTPMAP